MGSSGVRVTKRPEAEKIERKRKRSDV